MADLNQFCFTGRVAQDATVRTLATGKKVLTVNVAINTGFGDYKKTLFVKVQQWGDRGEKIVQYLKKGQLVASNGELSRNEWGDEGNKKVDFVVDVMSIQLLGSKQQGNTSAPAAPEMSSSLPDDIPF